MDAPVLTQQLVDKKGRVWQEQTVVMQKDESGFGFTLSKEMPVFVENVAGGSSAARAGVQAGDRITKVNGISVMGHKHNDVVGMIRDSSHVTITLARRSAQNGTRGPTKEGLEISPPRQLQELTLQSLRSMLHKQRSTFERLTVDYTKLPSDKLEKELHDSESIIRILEGELAAKCPSVQPYLSSTDSSVQTLSGQASRSKALMEDPALTRKILGRPPAEEEGPGGSRPAPPTSASPTKGSRLREAGSPKPVRSHTFSNGSPSPMKSWKGVGPSVSHGVSDMTTDFSDDDLSEEVDGASEAGPFGSLQELRNNPAHMAVFLHYLFLNKQPKYLLFHLVTNSHYLHCKPGDLRQRGKDIFWTFFLDSSPLPLEIPEAIRLRISTTLETEESESKLRNAFAAVRESISEAIMTDLANYRHKRVIGMAGMFGDNMLSRHMPIVKQLEVVQNTLLPDIKQCLDEKHSSSPEVCSRNHAIAACMTTFLLDALGKDRLPGNNTAPLDRVQTFSRADISKSNRKFKKKVTKNNHTFQLCSYEKPTMCGLCGFLLWGVVYHGYQCTTCELNVHRYCNCINDIADPCPTKSARRKKSTPIRKLSLSAFTPPLEDVESADSAILRDDEEGERVSPSSESTGHGREEGAGDLSSGRDRAVSEPKVVALSPRPSGEPGLELRANHTHVMRTQSEHLHSRPEHLSSVKGSRLLTSDPLVGSSATLPWDDSVLSISARVGGLDSDAAKPGPIIDDNLSELLDEEVDEEPPPWALMARREVLQRMRPFEVQRQENIQELVWTERTHVHKLKIMRYIYKMPLLKESIISVKQSEQLFPSLEELILFHSGLCADLRERVNAAPNGQVKTIADVLLQRFEGAAGERLCYACSVFASNQVKADRLFKEWRRKNERFRIFVKNAETHPLCQRLTFHELLPIAWQRLTKYRLLIESILSSFKKHWGELDDPDKEEAQRMETALGCVKDILTHVNRQVRRAESHQRLHDYQSKLDLTAMEKCGHPIAQLFRSLDLSADNRHLVHEGPLTWRIQHRKVIELHALLLTDVLVLLERSEDGDRYVLRGHTLSNVSGSKEELSPVIRLKECLLRNAAADRGGRTFLVVNNSPLMRFAQMYEFIADGAHAKKQWEDAIKRAMRGTQDMSSELPSSPSAEEYGAQVPLGLSPLTSHLTLREQLDKIDEDSKKLLADKLSILRAMQGGILDRPTNSTPTHTTPTPAESPREIIGATYEQAGDLASILSHVMVPNPTKSIVAETQTRLTHIVGDMQKNLSKLLLVLGSAADSRLGGLEFEELATPTLLSPPKKQDLDHSPPHEYSREHSSTSSTTFDLPPLPEHPSSGESPELSCTRPLAHNTGSLGSGGGEAEGGAQSQAAELPADLRSPEGEDSATPTPQLEDESRESTPVTSPSDMEAPETSAVAPATTTTEVGVVSEGVVTLVVPSLEGGKRDSIGPSIRVLRILASPVPEGEEDGGEGGRSFSLSRGLPPFSTTSPDTDEEEEEEEAGEGTDL